MNYNFRIILCLFVAPLLFCGAEIVSATSGACSSHGGVNCSAGMQADGTVYCNDSNWTGSIVKYDYMAMCEDKKLSEINGYCEGLKAQFSYDARRNDQYLNEIEAMIDKHNSSLLTTDMSNPAVAASYNSYGNYLNELRNRQIQREAQAVQSSIRSCKTDKINEYNSSASLVQPRTNNQVCQDTYGSYSAWDGTKNSSGGLNCSCQTGYQWNSGNTSCVMVPLNNYQSGADNIVKSDYQPVDTFNNKVCKDIYGKNSNWDGTYNESFGLSCGCESGYGWNTDKTNCLLTQTLKTETIVAPKATDNEKPSLQNFKDFSLTDNSTEEYRVIEPEKRMPGDNLIGRIWQRFWGWLRR